MAAHSVGYAKLSNSWASKGRQEIRSSRITPLYFAKSWPDLSAVISPVRPVQIVSSLKNISLPGSDNFLSIWRRLNRPTFTLAWVCCGERSWTLKRRDLPYRLEYLSDWPFLEKARCAHSSSHALSRALLLAEPRSFWSISSRSLFRSRSPNPARETSSACLQDQRVRFELGRLGQ